MAVYTEISNQDLSNFVRKYDIGDALSAEGIVEGVENSNYLLKTTVGSFILTLYEKRVNPEDLPFFLYLKEHLAAKGLSCPSPLRALNGKILHSLSDRPAAIVTFLKGESPGRINLNHCAQLGAALAKMHLAGSDFTMTRSNALSVGAWGSLLENSLRGTEDLSPGLAVELQTELTALERNWPGDLPKGTIHSDVFPDNVLFKNGKLSGILDFYFACTDLFAYDLAVCINAWCFESDGSLNVNKVRRLLTSYRYIRPLSGPEIEALPILARGAAFRFLLTRMFDWFFTPVGAFVNKKDPLEYLGKLEFHQQIKGPSDYGIN